MPRLALPNIQSQAFTVNGSWKCPRGVTLALAVATSSGASFNGVGTVQASLQRLYTVSEYTSYAVVVGAGIVTVYWVAVRA